MKYLFFLYFLCSLSCLKSNEIPLDAKIYVSGHKGLVGRALIRKLEAEGYFNLLVRSHEELDLTNQQAVNQFFIEEKPEYVFLSAAKAGGILANSTNPAPCLYDNLMIETNVIHAAYLNGVKKLLFFGSSCIYPTNAPQPILEHSLLTGPLENINEPYAIAKISGIKLCQAYNYQYGTRFICCIPTNLYGPEDRFNLTSSHVLLALILKIEQARKNNLPSVQIWGTASPKKEFLYIDDLADAALFLMRKYEGNEIINVGCGKGLTIQELAEIIGEELGFQGDFIFNASKPDNTSPKLLDISKLKELGWTPRTTLREGIRKTIDWYEK